MTVYLSNEQYSKGLKYFRHRTKSPFISSSFYDGYKFEDFVGRGDELELFKQRIFEIMENGTSYAIQLKGYAGVGKSTLFNYLKKKIEDERANSPELMEFLGHNFNIFSIYFKEIEKISDFGDIFRKLQEAFYTHFDAEFGYEISLIEYVTYCMVFALCQKYPQEFIPHIFSGENARINPSRLKIEDIIEKIENMNETQQNKIKDLILAHAHNIIHDFSFSSKNTNYKISKRDLPLIRNLSQTFILGNKFLEKALRSDESLFPEKSDIIKFFNDLLRLYSCFTDQQPILLIGIDEFAKFPVGSNQNYYKNLAQMIVKLRNNLGSTLFVFISTTDDWNNFDSVLQANTDLLGQVSAYMENLTLKSLEIDDLIQVFMKRMDLYWKKAPHNRPKGYEFFPFSKELFKFVYMVNERDMRRSIIFLDKLWRNLQKSLKIPDFRNIYKIIAYARDTSWLFKLKNDQIEPYEVRLVSEKVKNSQEFMNNAKRSSLIEKGLTQAFRAIKQLRNFSEISSVHNNFSFTIKGTDRTRHKRRPDVLLKFNEDLGMSLKRYAEFQVKAYLPGKLIEKKHFESSLELLSEGYIDALIFIVTGGGFNTISKKIIEDTKLEFPNRIQIINISDHKQDYLYFLTQFETIFGINFDNYNNGAQIAHFLLEKSFQLNLDDLFQRILELPPNNKDLNNLEILTVDNFIEPENITPLVSNTLAGNTISTFSNSQQNQVISQPPIINEVDFHEKENSKLKSNLDFLVGQNPISDNTSLKSEDSGLKLNLETKSNFADLPMHWQQKPLINYVDYYGELTALVNYAWKRQTKLRYKFTRKTFKMNVIEKNAGLGINEFNELIEKMTRMEYLTKVKTSLMFTEEGKEFVKDILRELKI